MVTRRGIAFTPAVWDFCEHGRRKRRDDEPKPTPTNANTKEVNFMLRERWRSTRE